MLTNEEINTLIDMLDQFGQLQERQSFSQPIFELMLMPDKEKAKTMVDEKMAAAHERARVEREKIVLLQAKLIQMKDKNTVAAASEFLKNQ